MNKRARTGGHICPEKGAGEVADKSSVHSIIPHISDRRLAEAEFRLSQESLRTIFDSIHDAIFLHDIDGSIIDVNAKMLAMYGVSRDQAFRLTIKEDYSSPDNPLDRLEDMWLEVVGGGSRLFEWNARRPADGEVFPVEVFLSRISFHDRDVIMATVRDISERKRAEEAVRSLARFPEENPYPVMRIDRAGTLCYANPSSRRLIDARCFGTDEALPQDFLQAARDVFEMGERKQIEFCCADSIFQLMFTPAGPDHVNIYGMDVTDLKRAEESLQLAARVFENSVEGIAVTDSRANIKMVNPAFTTITAFTAEEVIGRNPRILKSNRHDQEFYRQMWDSLLEQGQWKGEIWNRRKGGESYPEWLSISAIKDGSGRTTNYVSVFHDISDLKRSEERIRHQAYHDALTGLPNRLLFKDRLEMAIAHARRVDEKLAVLFVDLDNFKHINDSLGHDSGDLLLQIAAVNIASSLRKEDTVSRLGGDEFIILQRQIGGPEDAAIVAEKILAALAGPVNLKGHEVYITASIGITVFPADGEDPETLVKNADMAMYQAKGGGRNAYHLFTLDMNDKVGERLALESGLRRGFERQEFEVHYQPRVELAGGRIVGMEALVRWRHPERGLVSPVEFIPVAEETGLILPLGEWVLRESCRQAKIWRDQGWTGFTLAVNLSARQFRDPNLAGMVRRVLGDTGFPADHLDLEITESMLMTDIDSTVGTMHGLTDLGVRFSLDDFGTGYSSLYYLRQLPIHSLKIDRSFVKNINTDRDDNAIISAIISIAKTINIDVIAEGVETWEQLAFLHGQDCCHEIQGFLFSPPVPAAEFEQLLATDRRLDISSLQAAACPSPAESCPRE